MSISNIALILCAMLLVLLNAFFVAAEFAMVKMRATRVETIKNSHGLKGKILYKIHTNLDAYLSVCQLGITLASLGLGWIGEPAFFDIVQSIFIGFGVTSESVISAVSFAIAFAIISFLHIVVGELMPKSLAIRKAELISMWTSIPLYVFYWIMYPAIFVLNYCSNFLLRVLKISSSHHRDENFYSSDEIKLIVDASHLHGQLTDDEAEIVGHTIELGDLEVSEIMRPMHELKVLHDDQPIKVQLQKMLMHKYSRYPIYDTKKKEIIGIVHIKNVFATLLEEGKIKNLTKVMRPVLKIQHNLPAMNLVHKFRDNMTHLALVYENKQAIGFVTLDNLLHVMIGKINDEFHRTHDDWAISADETIIVKGSCSLYYLERALDRDIILAGDEQDLDTIAELVVQRLGRQPLVGDTIQINNLEAKVQEIHDGIIRKIIIKAIKS